MLPEAGPAKVKAPSDQFNGQFNLDQTAKKKRGGAAFVCLFFVISQSFPTVRPEPFLEHNVMLNAQTHPFQRSTRPVQSSNQFRVQTQHNPVRSPQNKSTGSCFALLSPAFQAKKMTKKKVWRDANGKQIQKTQTSVFPFRNKKGSSFNSHFVRLYRIMVANKQKQRRLIIEEEEKAQQKRSEDSLSCQVGALCRMNWQVA